jgi:protein-S-isoprenylcysteine O-methyltransferase Ste14
MDLSFQTLSFVATLLLSNYTTNLCLTSPNAQPSNPHPNDRLQNITGTSKREVLRFRIYLTIWTYQLLIILFPSQRSKVCLHPDLLNPALFTWSPRAIAAFTTVFVFGSIRLQAYRALGPNFTFRLAAPTKLVTTGIYRYIQHPSYVGLFAVRCADVYTLQRLDGVAACILPGMIVGVPWLSEVIGTVMMGLFVWVLGMRVKDEEEMMREQFGEEWEVWHRKTARFIPGIL